MDEQLPSLNAPGGQSNSGPPGVSPAEEGEELEILSEMQWPDRIPGREDPWWIRREHRGAYTTAATTGGHGVIVSMCVVVVALCALVSTVV